MSAVLKDLRRRKVVAVIRANSAENAITAARGLADGGVTSIEITCTTPDAATAIADLSSDPNLVVGAGTVLDADQTARVVDAGAEFVVSPHLSLEVLEAGAALGVLTIPGAFTPTEIETASRHTPLVKLFPAGTVGPTYIRALRGPFPKVQIMPSGGVSPGNARQWLESGATVLGAGSDLCPAAAVAAGDTDELRRRAQAFMDAVTEEARLD